MKVSRPPVVAVMGHIDHGKSTLLDYIRKSNVVESEAGGITQHVSAYEITHPREDGRPAKITFLDTPGHEAFQGIRARGARAADIGVLVVSAEDGVKPQTLEAYKRIQESELPYIVAITKIDKTSADIDRAKQSLAENDIFVEGYGGDVPVVALSAKTGEGVKELLDMILLIAELENFVGEHDRWGSGTIIESRLDPKKGITIVGVIKDGTVSVGQVAASAGAMAPIRFLLTAEGEQVKTLTFSSPVQIVGWDNLPQVGAVFEIFDDKVAAQFYAESEAAKSHTRKTEVKIEEGMTILPIILKADTAGSLEAIHYELGKLSHERIVPKIVLSAVGTVSEGDVKSAMTTEGTKIFGFNTKVDPQAAALAERSAVVIETFDIIYKLTERVEALLLEQEPRIQVEEVAGSAKILKVFSIQKDKQVAGARMQSGMFEKNALVRIMRREEEIGRGKVKELQQSKIDVDTVSEGSEFGMMLEAKAEVAPGDILERIIVVTK
ncbi:translation initiation factor IF-2 [Candidatus Parcubacteria bacterium]|nr:translation initiation factor IF-2 [Candidatus Parcubacteria bacterium]